MEDYFKVDLGKCSIININDGCIKRIFVADSSIKKLDRNDSVDLETGENAIIEFSNGKFMLIHNSEWCTLFLNKKLEEIII